MRRAEAGGSARRRAGAGAPATRRARPKRAEGSTMKKLVLAGLAGLAALAACSSSTPNVAPTPPPAPAPVAKPAPPPAAAVPDVDVRRKQLAALLTEQWEYFLQRRPELSTIFGDTRYNDKWSDNSPEAIAADLAKTKEFHDRFAAVDTTGFPEQEALNQELMVRQLQMRLDDAKFEEWLMPVNQ